MNNSVGEQGEAQMDLKLRLFQTQSNRAKRFKRRSREQEIEANNGDGGGGEDKRSGEDNEGYRDFSSMSLLFSEDVLDHVLRFVTTHKDRNAASMVCKAWYRSEARSRESVFVGNCYAVTPDRVAERFCRMKSLTLKGKPRFADFDLVPRNWGAFVLPWIQTLARTHPFLEELRLKRMTILDDCMHLISSSFPRFKVLVLTSCDGFSSDGLSCIASCCKHLTHLELTENLLNYRSMAWLKAFPETNVSLVSLNFEDLEHGVDIEDLEALVSRCHSLQSLHVNRAVTLGQLQRLLAKAPQLTEVGTGTFYSVLSHQEQASMLNTFTRCLKLQSLSGFWDVEPGNLSLIYPVCSNLVSLNLSYSPISSVVLADLVSHCFKLRRLWLMDTVEDSGLQAVAECCRDLEDLRVYPANREEQGAGVTEDGLVYIAEGCRKLTHILYFCGQMTNAAVEIMAMQCLSLISFRLCIMEPARPDHTTSLPMDEGFGAIVRHCKALRRLSVSGWLTDKAFEYIGRFGKRLERLSVAFAGESDVGLQHVLRGCTNLRKLEIRDSPFGDMALLSGMHRYESMRSLWMSNCSVTIGGCSWLASQKPRLNVEIIRNTDDSNTLVESLYVYRSVAGHRKDMPLFVQAL